MKIEMKEITLREVLSGYLDSGDNGVTAYNGRLDVRPPFQREFIYKEQQRNEVIRTVKKGFPLNVMYWSVSGKNEKGEDIYELLDGQQRTISLGQYYNGDFSLDELYFKNLSKEAQDIFLDYKLNIYVCEGSQNEKLAWFEIINIAGEELTPQELRNAIYAGPWLADAKSKFSKNSCVAFKIGEPYITGELKRQNYLETALSWIADKEKTTIKEYMALHQDDKDAEELWDYFKKVINWVKLVFPTEKGKKPRKEMKGIKWGILYNRYASTFKVSLADKVDSLMADEDILKKSGIYEYILSGNEKFLNIRTFKESQKRTAFEKQQGKCAKCGKLFAFEEMEADHIIPWSKGGKTTDDNVQMLCKMCNREKSDK